MRFRYRWTLDEEAYGFLRAMKTRKRRRLERFIELLAMQPFTEPDYVDLDSDGAELFHLFVGEYTLVYHVDHAVHRVLVYEIYANP